jgi:ABC-type branched-subunit amino acid transport system ATPase component
MPAIDVRDIAKHFGDFTAVDGISFSVEAGEIFGLLGPNGAGKSTLIRMLTTLLPPSAGTATVNGFDITTQANGVRESIGVIPQAMTSDLELSVYENLLIFAKLYGVPRERRDRLIERGIAPHPALPQSALAPEQPQGRQGDDDRRASQPCRSKQRAGTEPGRRGRGRPNVFD